MFVVVVVVVVVEARDESSGVVLLWWYCWWFVWPRSFVGGVGFFFLSKGLGRCARRRH